MQDIDFEALDQAVNKIMDQAKIDSEQIKHVEQVKKQRRMGRSMDIINSGTKNTAPATAQQIRETRRVTANAMNRAQSHRAIQDIVRKAPAKKPIISEIKKPTSSAPETKTSARQAVEAAVVNAVETPVTNSQKNNLTPRIKVRRAELLRQRRRGGKASQLLTTKDQDAKTEPNQPAVLRGKIQTETLSTKQPDGTEMVYNRSEFDYAVKIGDEVAVDSPRVALPRTSTPLNLNSGEHGTHQLREAEPTSVEHKTIKPLVVKNHNTNLDAQPAAQAASLTHQKDQKNEAELNRSFSPFIETAKVEKRPLGTPERVPRVVDETSENPKISFGDNEDVREREPRLYNGNSRVAEDSEKTANRWLAWVVAVIAVVAIVGLVFYFVYVYNK